MEENKYIPLLLTVVSLFSSKAALIIVAAFCKRSFPPGEWCTESSQIAKDTERYQFRMRTDAFFCLSHKTILY